MKIRKISNKLILFCSLLLFAPVFTGISDLTVQTVQAEEGSTTSDSTSDRSITIYKYAIKDLTEQGGRGDGTEDQLTDKTPLPGIKFQIQRVTPKPGKTLKNAATQPDDYDIDNTFPTQTVTTDANGEATAKLGTGKTADGTYLVTELPDDRVDVNGDPVLPKVASPAPPFFVRVPQTNREDRSSLIYNVKVHPKNMLEMLTELDKTIEGKKSNATIAGEKFTWHANLNIPSGLYFKATEKMELLGYHPDGTRDTTKDRVVEAGEEVYADYFRITDPLNGLLNLDDVEVKVGDRSDDSLWEDLVINVDYTVTVNGVAKTTHPVTDAQTGSTATRDVVVELTDAGKKKVDDLLKRSTNPLPHLRVLYTTHTEKEVNASIDNMFKLEYLIPGTKPFDDETPEDPKPENHTGGFDLLKLEEGSDDKVLEGAEFHIAKTEEDAKAGLFLASNGLSYALTDTLPSDVTFVKAVTDSDGKAEFNGLPLDETTITRKYWVVETKAPNGYNLLDNPVAVDVDLTTEKDDTIELTVYNKIDTDLPFTGGNGTTMLIIIAVGSLVIGSAAIVIEKKRRNA